MNYGTSDELVWNSGTLFFFEEFFFFMSAKHLRLAKNRIIVFCACSLALEVIA